MGLFDTIHFDNKLTCKTCGNAIESVQVNEFAQLLNEYHVKDCISHAEDVRIVKEELFCDKCGKRTGEYVYIGIHRGIIVGVTDSFQEAQNMLQDLNLEKLILWYHDLFRKYRDATWRKNDTDRFLRHLVEWFAGGNKTDAKKRLLLFGLDLDYLEGAQDPIEALKKYLDQPPGGSSM